MTDEELRLECLKLAFKSYGTKAGFGEYVYEFNRHIPENVTKLSNKYFEYLETGIPAKPEQ